VRVTKPFAAGPAGAAKRGVKPDGDCACDTPNAKTAGVVQAASATGCYQAVVCARFIAMDPGAASSGLE
jgi:hypothetical protein